MDTIVSTITLNKKGKTIHGFLIFLFIVIPYTSLISYFLPLKKIGVSIPYFLVISLLFLYFLFKIKKKAYYFNAFLILILLTLIVLLIRSLIGIGANLSNPILLLNQARWVFLIPMMIVVSREILTQTSKRALIERVIISVGVISALVAISYTLEIHSFRLPTDDPQLQVLIEKGIVTRPSGIWSGTNFYAAMLMLSLWVLARKKITKFNLPLMLIIYCGVLISGSKLPIIVATLLVLYYFFLYKTKKKFIIALLTIFILIGIFVGMFYQSFNWQRTLDIIDYVFYRVSPGQIWDTFTSRISKSLVGIKALFSRPVFLLIGTDAKSLIDPSTPAYLVSGLTFSDNSFVQGMVTIGIPVFLFFLYVCKKCFRENFKSRSQRAYLFSFYVIVVLLTNNAILWDTWVWYAIMTYLLLQPYQKLTYEQTVEKQGEKKI